MSVPTDDVADILVDLYNQDYELTTSSSKSTAKVSRKRHNRDTDAVVGPVFNIISDTTAARLKIAAAMAAGNQTEDGCRFATELSSTLKAVDAEPATLIMWPAEDLDEGEVLNGDTSADLNWVLAIIISLSPTTTRARILGTSYGLTCFPKYRCTCSIVLLGAQCPRLDTLLDLRKTLCRRLSIDALRCDKD